MLHSPQILLTPKKATVVAAGSVWDSTNKGTEITLSQTTLLNDTATNTVGGGSWSTVKGAQGRSTGKWYLELKFIAGSTSSLVVGFADATTGGGAGLNAFTGQIFNSVGNLEAGGQGFQAGGYTANNASAGWGPLLTNDIMQLALDGDNGFGYLGKNGTWLTFGGSVGDPTSGVSHTGAAFSFTGTPTLFPAISLINTTDGSIIIKTTSFSFSPPAGSSAWG